MKPEPPKCRGQRAISTEEVAFFRTTFKDVKPLRRSPVPVARAAPAANSVPKPAPKPAASPRPTPGRIAHNPTERLPAIDGHRVAKLRRGQLMPDARFDLHGFTQSAAHAALLRFLSRAQGDGARLVLIVTGKSGVLHDAVPRWLTQAPLKPLVAGTGAAHRRHGGEGALYVTLKRKAARG